MAIKFELTADEMQPIIAAAVAEAIKQLRADEGFLAKHVALSPAEAAAALSISEKTLKDKTAAGEIPTINVGQGENRQHVRYLAEDLLAWARGRRNEKKPEG